MREALARSDNDFLVAEPRRRKPAPRKQSPFGTMIAVGRVFGKASHYPNRVGGALLIGIAGAITINALELQTARHPAPLFGQPAQSRDMTPATPAPAPAPRAAMPAASPAPAPVATPAPAAAPVANDPLGQFMRQDEQPVAVHKASTAQHPAHADAISQILRDSSDATKTAPPQPSQAVYAVQKALVKLGFVLKVDGIEGDATRRAIVAYEHDRGLPQRGELSPKLIRKLSAESNIAIP